MRAITTFVFAALALWSLAGASLAAEPQGPVTNGPPPKQFGDWFLRCQQRENALPCDILFSLVDKQSKALVLALSLAYSPQQDKHAIQITLPLGIDLRRGVDLEIGKVNIKAIHPTRCELSGCVVEAILAPDVLEALKSNPTGKIHVSADGKSDTSLDFSLKGFSEAYATLLSETKARQ